MCFVSFVKLTCKSCHLTVEFLLLKRFHGAVHLYYEDFAAQYSDIRIVISAQYYDLMVCVNELTLYDRFPHVKCSWSQI